MMFPYYDRMICWIGKNGVAFNEEGHSGRGFSSATKIGIYSAVWLWLECVSTSISRFERSSSYCALWGNIEVRVRLFLLRPCIDPTCGFPEIGVPPNHLLQKDFPWITNHPSWEFWGTPNLGNPRHDPAYFASQDTRGQSCLTKQRDFWHFVQAIKCPNHHFVFKYGIKMQV